MRIALVTTEYPAFNNAGGIGTFSYYLAHLLSSQGHSVYVITETDSNQKDHIVQDGVTIVPLLKNREIPYLTYIKSLFFYNYIVRILKKYIPSISKLILLNLSVYETVKILRKKYSFEILHTSIINAPALLLSFLSNVPIIAHSHGPDELLQPFDYISFDTRIKTLVENFFMYRAMYIVACSKSVFLYLKKKHILLRQKMLYIPNFLPSSIVSRHLSVVDTSVLLFFGRIEKRKGPDIALQAFIHLSHIYKHLTLVFLGEDTISWRNGDKLISFRAYIDNMKLSAQIRKRIKFIPRIDSRRKLIRFLLKKHCITVLPSRYEPFGYVYIESMASGCMTIASKSGGGEEIILDGKDGFLIDPIEKDLVHSIQRILSMTSEQRKRITQNAYNKIAHMYTDISVNRLYEKMYLDIRRHYLTHF